MANEYVSLTEIKDWLGIGNTDQDTILDIVREAASRAVDNHTDRRFYLDGTATKRYYTARSSLVYIEDIGDDTGITVKTDDDDDGTFENSWTQDDPTTERGFRLEPLNAELRGEPFWKLRAISGRFPTTNRGIEVTAKHGYGSTVPPAVKQATLLTAEAIWRSSGLLHQTAGSPGVQSVSLEGSDSITFATGSHVTEVRAAVPPAAQNLLAEYQRVDELFA